MKAQESHCLRLPLSFLLVCLLAGVATPVNAQPKELKADNTNFPNRSAFTDFELNLSECFATRLGVGKYELRVKSADTQENLKDQTAVKKFEIDSR